MSYRSELIQVAAVALAAVQNEDTGSTDLSTGPAEDHLYSLVSDIMVERRRQEEKWGPQSHNRAWWLVILAEEFGEAARATLEDAAAEKGQK